MILTEALNWSKRVPVSVGDTVVATKAFKGVPKGSNGRVTIVKPDSFAVRWENGERTTHTSTRGLKHVGFTYKKRYLTGAGVFHRRRRAKNDKDMTKLPPPEPPPANGNGMGGEPPPMDGNGEPSEQVDERTKLSKAVVAVKAALVASGQAELADNVSTVNVFDYAALLAPDMVALKKPIIIRFRRALKKALRRLGLVEQLDLFRSNEPTQHYGLSLQAGGFGVPDSPYGKRGSRRKPPRKKRQHEAEQPLLTKGKHGRYVRVTFKSKRKVWAGMKKKGAFYRFFVLNREGVPKEIEKKGNIVQQELIIAAKSDILKIEPAHMSRKYGQLEIIKKGGVNERFAGAKAERGVWYHGTDFKYYRSIRKQGLIPDPRTRTWASDPDASFRRPSRKSYAGIYVTTNLMTARSSAPGNPGSESLIVVMDLQPRTMWADEDALTYWLSDIPIPGLVTTEPGLASLYVGWKYGEPIDKKTAAKARRFYITGVVKQLLKDVKEPHPKLRSRVTELVKKAWGAALMRKVAYVSNRTWQRGFWDIDPMMDPEKMAPKPDKGEAEKQYAKITDRLTRTLKRLTLPSVVPDDFNRTARVLKPIGYSGRNRIVALVKSSVVKEGGQHIERVLYGKVPPQFIKDWTRAVGKWKPVKESMDEAVKRRHPHLQNLLDIENSLGIYSTIGVPDYVRKDAGKLYDAIQKKNKKVMRAILKKHEKQMTKGDVQGGPKQVKVGSAPRSAIARAALYYLNPHLAEAEEPGGDDPADTAAAKTLSRQMLKQPSTALSFRQLWRHKYVEKNLDSSKAWKLFYWNMAKVGAGGKGFNPNTRIAAAKLMVSAFNKWAKAGMKAKVKRADGVQELPVGQISRAEFIKWYSGGGKSESLDEVLRFTRQQRLDIIDSAIGQYELAGEKVRGKHAAFKGDYATRYVMRAVDRFRGAGTAEDKMTRKQLDKLVRDAIQVYGTQQKLKQAFPRKPKSESLDEIVNPADFREVNRYVMQVYNDIERDAPGTLLKLFKRKKPSRNIEYKPTTVRAGRENRNVHGISFIEQYRLVREKDGEVMVQEKTVADVRSFAEDDQEMDWIIDANYDNDVARGYYRDEFGNRLTIERVDTVSTDEIFLAHGGPPRIIAPGSVPGLPKYGRTVFPGDEPPEPVRRKPGKKTPASLKRRLQFATGPVSEAYVVRLKGIKRGDRKLVALFQSGGRKEPVIGYGPTTEVQYGSLKDAKSFAAAARKAGYEVKSVKSYGLPEALATLFVEQEPPNGNGNGKEKTKPTTKDAKKAEKEDFDIDDIQLYYDMQVAGGEDGKVALRLTKRKFKIKTLTVNPAGRVMVKGMEKPSPPAALPLGPAAPAGEPPPEEPPPEEPPPPPEKRPPESLASAFIETRHGDERPPTRTVGGMVGGGPIPRTGGSLWPIRTSFRSQAKPLATAQSSVKKPHPGEPLYKAGAI